MRIESVGLPAVGGLVHLVAAFRRAQMGQARAGEKQMRGIGMVDGREQAAVFGGARKIDALSPDAGLGRGHEPGPCRERRARQFVGARDTVEQARRSGLLEAGDTARCRVRLEAGSGGRTLRGPSSVSAGRRAAPPGMRGGERHGRDLSRGTITGTAQYSYIISVVFAINSGFPRPLRGSIAIFLCLPVEFHKNCLSNLRGRPALAEARGAMARPVGRPRRSKTEKEGMSR